MPVFIYLMEDKIPLNQEIITKHIHHLRQLDEDGVLVLCGPFADYAGGIVIVQAADKETALRIALADPFVNEGYKTFTLRTLEIANASNGYLE